MNSHTHPLGRIQGAGYSVLYSGLSALNVYFGYSQAPVQYIATDADLVALARIFPGLEYPGLPGIDAVYSERGVVYGFSCYEIKPMQYPLSILNLLYDPARQCFRDPAGVYYDIQKRVMKLKPCRDPLFLLEQAAIVVAHYDYVLPSDFPWHAVEHEIAGKRHPSSVRQRFLLDMVLHGKHADMALSLLYRSGYIEAYWPELGAMTAVLHDKEFHPEGNAWQHTLTALTHRKTPDPVVSLALLLHDTGKAAAEATRDNAFDQHSWHSMRIARRFMKRLGYSAETAEDVLFLIAHHMLPGALARLPRYKTAPLMDSTLFPLLLEVYRADMASTFSKLDGYYEACREYKQYQKEKNNPFRNEMRKIR